MTPRSAIAETAQELPTGSHCGRERSLFSVTAPDTPAVPRGPLLGKEADELIINPRAMARVPLHVAGPRGRTRGRGRGARDRTGGGAGRPGARVGRRRRQGQAAARPPARAEGRGVVLGALR